MKKKLISVTQKDLKFDYLRGSGPGGQHRNKTSTACRCTHPPSKATGFSQEYKSQKQNKEAAFKRMASSKKFQKWIRLESAKALGIIDKIEKEVEEEMKNIKIESVNEIGQWIELSD